MDRQDEPVYEQRIPLYGGFSEIDLIEKPAIDLFGQVSTADTGVRSDLDFYETPTWMTRSLLHFHPAIRQTTVLECCSGRDAITRVLREEG